MAFDQKLFDEICEDIAGGLSIREACKKEGRPDRQTFMRWARQDDDLYVQYTRAREISVDVLADEILDIADAAENDWMKSNDPNNPGFMLNGEHIQRSKARISARQWYVGKIAPKRFGERISQEITGKDGAPLEAPILNVNFSAKEPSGGD